MVQADQAGAYHLFCTQFCGTDHSAMVGEVDVMTPPDYEKWLDRRPRRPRWLVAKGARCSRRYGCSGLPPGGHGGGGTVRAPRSTGCIGSPVPLDDGTVVTADDKYIRDSILMPAAQIVAGYANRMPSFAGQIGEEDLIKLIAYIKSLRPRAAEDQPGARSHRRRSRRPHRGRPATT